MSSIDQEPPEDVGLESRHPSVTEGSASSETHLANCEHPASEGPKGLALSPFRRWVKVSLPELTPEDERRMDERDRLEDAWEAEERRKILDRSR